MDLRIQAICIRPLPRNGAWPCEDGLRHDIQRGSQMPDTGQVVSNGNSRNGADAPAGLEGVVVAHTQIGDVRGLEGFYHYRQYDAIELAEKRSLEDVWHLLFEGELPSLRQRDEFIEEVKPWRTIPVEVKELLPEVAALG